MLSEEDRTEIIGTLHETLEARRTIPEAQHTQDHDFVQTMIINARKKSDMYDQVKLHIVKFGALGVVTGTLAAAWLYLREAIHSGVPHP